MAVWCTILGFRYPLGVLARVPMDKGTTEQFCLEFSVPPTYGPSQQYPPHHPFCHVVILQFASLCYKCTVGMVCT